MTQYALVSGTNTFVEAGSLGQVAHDQGNLPPSKRARAEASSPAANGTLQTSSDMPNGLVPSEQDEEVFVPPAGPPKKGVTK